MEHTDSKLELTGADFLDNRSKFDVCHKSFSFTNNFLQKRYIVSVMLGLCLLIAFINRINMNVAIISMTSDHSNYGNLQWDEQDITVVLSSFFWGYILTQIPAGQLGQCCSPKLLLGITNLISCLVVVLMPITAFSGGWRLISAARAIVGICQGFIPALVFKLAANWFPPNERNRLLGISLSGSALGMLIGLPLCGKLAGSGGWPSIFFVSAALTLIWTLLWAWLGADSPATHQSISPQERNYVETSLMICTSNQKLKTPWMEIFKSIPFWALIFTHVSAGFGQSFFLQEIPFFINGILKSSVIRNGVLGSVPFFTTWILIYPTCCLADYLLMKNILSRCGIRKIWTSLHLTVSSLCLLSLGLVKKQLFHAMLVITMSSTFHAFLYSGFIVNPLDLAPNFAGILYSLTNTAENLAGLIAPLITGVIVHDISSMEQWWIMFAIVFGVSIIGNATFLVFGSTDLQRWNSIK